MKTFNILILLTALLLVGCNKQELVEDDLLISTLDNTEEATTRKSSRPLKGTVLVMPDPGIVLTCDDCVFLSALDGGEGNLTHMGKVTLESITCVAFITEPPNTPPPDGAIIGFSIASQCVNVTAANGDKITLELDIPFDMNYKSECECFTGVGEYNITGGTGRFEDATTEFTDPISIRTSNDFTGTITTEWDGEFNY